MDVNPVKAKLAQNLPSLGTWSASGDPSVIETLLHTTDFDWVTLDFEHNPIDVSTAVNCLRAGNGSGKPMFARIPSNDPIWVKRVLDIGFTGTVVPDVKDEEEAERAVQAATLGVPNTDRAVCAASAPPVDKSFTAATTTKTRPSTRNQYSQPRRLLKEN